ncbi:MAG TPA: aconitate hydratase AcnA, partial [Magnetospirillum sp.]|nr:aconitate hydratase AcnA [Magnetospirillum sp.]
VGKFVEYFGPGLESLSLADRSTIANMGPEYGATCGFFPVDAETVNYLKFSGRSDDRIALVDAYAKAQGMYRTVETVDPVFTDVLELDLSTVVPSLAGPKRPEGRVSLTDAKAGFTAAMETEYKKAADLSKRYAVDGKGFDIGHGDVVIAAITSCTNTSNPNVMLAAGLLAKKAVERGVRRKPWVKTSLAPGSQVVPDYLRAAGVQTALDALGFTIAGFGCTTCIGNSGPLDAPISAAVDDNNLVVAAVLSGNRNFEGRISPHVKANYLASPPLVVAYALAGTMNIDLTREPLGTGADGNPVFLRDIWPSSAEVNEAVAMALSPDSYRQHYANVFEGPEAWRKVRVATGQTYAWDPHSTYIKNPPYFDNMPKQPPAGFTDIIDARPLAILGDSITTDHISPAGNIKKTTPAGRWLLEHGVAPEDFNSYGARRGHDQVMTRGTFANVRLKNEMVPGVEGGATRINGQGDAVHIFDAAMVYAEDGVPLVVIAGKEYGTGSSRDWAAKGTSLLGVKAVIAESFERIHRSNLVGMGVLPLQFKPGTDRKTLALEGTETFSVTGMAAGLKPRQELTVTVTRADGRSDSFPVLSRIDTVDEVEYFRHGGILHAVLRALAVSEGAGG